MDFKGIQYLVVGAGITGITVAERIANGMGERVALIEKRDHIGGNCYSYIDQETGIECHKYGTHVFHTSKEKVWSYINRFDRFNDYRHRVLSQFGNRLYPIPINLLTINNFFEVNLKPFEAERMPKQYSDRLHRAFFNGYSRKQWGDEIPTAAANRIPFRIDYNPDYFNDTFQGVPISGWGKLFNRMLFHKNISIEFNTDFFNIRNQIPKDMTVIYTGPIDRYFDHQYGRLSWRSASFEKKVYNCEDYQGTAVIHYADALIPYTRTHEYRHLHPERKYSGKTVVVEEIPRETGEGDEPFWPVHVNGKQANQYRQKAQKEKNVYFCGRLGTYSYFDMDDSIEDALRVYERIRNN